MATQIIAIIGATGSGKSALAMEVARGLREETGGESSGGLGGAEILSVDSMQVYRGMDIGTAKPTAAERAEVRHHLIDVCEPTEQFTAARFVEMAGGVIADKQAGEQRGKGRTLIAVGGTPLYFKSLFGGIFEGPAADQEIRRRLGEQEPAQLHAALARVDPAAAARIHANDAKRLIRALEVFEQTGRPISQLQVQWEAAPRYEAIWIGLEWERQELNRRINARVKAMLEAGWMDEVKGLLGRFGELSATAAEATGYAELIAVARGRGTLADAAEQIKIATRQLARRQMKWFRRFAGVHWLSGQENVQSNARAVLELLDQRHKVI
jgi:tRNA dimethylallyltransferase